jgi:purine-nucleoside phosphorylase
MVIGNCEKIPLAVMQGRAHLYEGHALRDIVFPVRVFGAMGVKAVVLTNAAGGIHPDYAAGCLVVVRDHINLQGTNPLLGPNDDRLGPRFLDLTDAYYRPYRDMALEAGKRLGIAIYEGVYAALPGPTYETPAEIRFLRTIGTDLVGMSTVPEVIAARHIGVRVLAISCVTNLAAGLSGHPLSHEEVLATGERVKEQLLALLQAVLPGIARDLAQERAV